MSDEISRDDILELLEVFHKLNHVPKTELQEINGLDTDEDIVKIAGELMKRGLITTDYRISSEGQKIMQKVHKREYLQKEINEALNK